MDTKEFVMVLVVALVGCVMVGCFVPTITQITDPDTEFSNVTDSLYYVEEITSDSPDYTMEYVAGESTLKINGVDVVRKSGTILCDLNEYVIRDRGTSIQWVDPNGNITIGDSTIGFTMQIVNGNATITRTIGDPIELTLTSGYAIMPMGDFVMKSPTQNAYIKGDSPIVAMGLTTINGEWRTLFQITGTVENISVVNLNGTYTIENVVVDYSTVAGYDDLYTINKVTFDAVKVDDSTIRQSCTYNYFIVPNEVVAEKTIHADGPTSSVINLLPLICTVGLLLGVVGYFFSKRYF